MIVLAIVFYGPTKAFGNYNENFKYLLLYQWSICRVTNQKQNYEIFQ